MGFWESDRGIIGDSWADALGQCFEDLGKDETSSGHQITMGELADLIEFCSLGLLEVRVDEGNLTRQLSTLHD